MGQMITEIIGGDAYHYYPLGRYVVRAPDICGGRPTFKYTRIEITGTLERLASGEPVEVVVAGYQGRVSLEAIQEASQIMTQYFLSALPELSAA